MLRRSFRDLYEENLEKVKPYKELSKFNIHNHETNAFLMCVPYNISGENANNVWMKELKPEDKEINVSKALNQWMDLYNYLASMSLVYLIPTVPGLQDQVYTANLGCVLPHKKNKTVILSNFKSEPRIDEAQPGYDFFKMMGYKVIQSPQYFEGEADLKYLNGNTYVGAYGIRTSIECLNFLEQTQDMKVIKLKMEDEYLYHLDCVVFAPSKDKVMICTELVDPKTIKEIEKVSEVLDIDVDSAYSGACNSLRCGSAWFCASSLSEMKATDEYYLEEKTKIAKLEKYAAQLGMELILVNMKESEKSGAMLSCNVMSLTRPEYV